MIPNDESFEKQTEIAIDFLVHYKTYMILKEKLKEKLKEINKSKLFWTITNNAHVKLLIACWTKVLCEDNDKEKYRIDLYQSLRVTEQEWKKYWKTMKSCRDKFIAHTELDYNNPIPNFYIAYKSIIFYLEWMKRFFSKRDIIYVDDFEEYIEPYLNELREIIK